MLRFETQAQQFVTFCEKAAPTLLHRSSIDPRRICPAHALAMDCPAHALAIWDGISHIS